MINAIKFAIEEIEASDQYFDHTRYHESLNNLTPNDVYYGTGQAILEKRQRIKLKTIQQRRALHQNSKAA